MLCVDDPTQYAPGDYGDSSDPWEDHMHIPYCNQFNGQGEAACTAAKSIDPRGYGDPPSGGADRHDICRYRFGTTCDRAWHVKYEDYAAYMNYLDDSFHFGCEHISEADCPTSYGCKLQAP